MWSGHEIEATEWFEAARRFGIAARWGTWHDFGIAYYLADRYQDAVMIELEGANRQANDWITPLILAAAYAQLGNAEQAADAVRDLLRLRPFFSIEQWASQFPDPDDAAHMVIGLETAGLGKSIEEE